MIKFKDSIADLRKHESTIYHNNSLKENSRFVAVKENKKHASARNQGGITILVYKQAT